MEKGLSGPVLVFFGLSYIEHLRKQSNNVTFNNSVFAIHRAQASKGRIPNILGCHTPCTSLQRTHSKHFGIRNIWTREPLFGIPTANHQPPTANRQPPTAKFGIPTASFGQDPRAPLGGAGSPKVALSPPPPLAPLGAFFAVPRRVDFIFNPSAFLEVSLSQLVGVPSSPAHCAQIR